jgi:hypothetical protein
VASLVAVGVLIWPVTDLIAAHDVGSAITGAARAGQLQTAREAVRTQLLTLGAGISAAGALAFTARSFTLTRQGQVSDRYSRAVDQLGSDKIDVRIGGIYSLESVVRDSPGDHATVMEVLCAFIREHPAEQQALPVDDETGPRLAADVQAALTVVGRRNAELDIPFRGPDLSHAALRGASISFGNFSGTRFLGADLSYAQCEAADFSHAIFTEAKITRAFLGGVAFKVAGSGDAPSNARVNLRGAVLRRADLTETNLNYADLRDALLYETNLTSTSLWGADLTGAEFRNADLSDADLTDARWPEAVDVPRGWRLSPSGTLEESPADARSDRSRGTTRSLTSAVRRISRALRGNR